MSRDAYTWPGGYPIAYFNKRGNVFCPGCAEDSDVGGVHWEGQPLYCEGCSAEIESAYGDHEEEE